MAVWGWGTHVPTNKARPSGPISCRALRPAPRGLTRSCLGWCVSSSRPLQGFRGNTGGMTIELGCALLISSMPLWPRMWGIGQGVGGPLHGEGPCWEEKEGSWEDPHCPPVSTLCDGRICWRKPGRGNTLLSKVRSLEHQHGHHLGVCWKYRISNAELLSQNLYYLKKTKNKKTPLFRDRFWTIFKSLYWIGFHILFCVVLCSGSVALRHVGS